jgi:fluoroacetyl-CoA thioesterase
MSPKLQSGLSFEWSYTVPARAAVPQLYHTPSCVDMPEKAAA